MEVEPTVPASRGLSVAALLLLLTSLLLPWWGVRYGVLGGGGRWERVAPFRADALTAEWATVLTGVLVVAAAALLFVRIAGQSWRYEPAAYLRDMRVAMALVALALLSVMLWPDAHPHVWGHLQYDWQGTTFTEDARPILGFWLAVVAGLLLGIGSLLDHRDMHPKAQ